MKKRILALLLVAAMSFSVLAACGSKNDETPTPDNTPEASAPVESEKPAFSADLAEFYNKIMNAAEEGPFMMDVAAEAEMLEMTFPGLANIETKQLVAAAPMMSAVAVEFVFVEVANASDVEAVKTILQTRIVNQVAGGAWYPETIEQWEKHSEIVVIDNYVCLFVCAEKDGMIDAFRNGTPVPTWAKAQGEVEGDMGIMDMPVEDGPAAFDPEPVPMPEVLASLALNKTDFTLKSAGASYKLKAEVTGTASPVVWTSSNEAVATVAEDGTVTAVAPGTATITVACGDMTVDCIVRCDWEAEEQAPDTSAPEVSETPEAPSAGAVDLAAFYSEIMASGGENSPAMMEVAGEYLDAFYPGLAQIAKNQCVVYTPMISAVACEVAMVECANAADVDAVKAILQARVDSQVAGGAWYPETIDGWQNNSKIVVKGNYVALFVIPEGLMDAATEFGNRF
jgi:predicted small lipoprotein YifL